MITGVRLTQLAEGEPLLGTSWNYQNLYGVDAVEKRLQDLFYYAKYLGFNYIIDTVKPTLDVDGNLTLDNNGLYGNIWSFDRRMELYRQYARETQIKILLEIDFPTNVTDDNLQNYADYFTNNLIQQYSWVLNWQIMVTPETIDSFGNYKCSPENYIKFMRIIYPKVKQFNDLIKIGGPGVFNALAGFYYNNDAYSEQWLSIAMGEKYGQDSQYDSIGPLGFMPYIDFFSIQGKQNTEALNYNVFPLIINSLNEVITSKSNKTIPIYSLVQGWQAASNDTIALNQQGYYELREILNCIRKNVIPFKYQLVDEYSGDPNKLNYGLFDYYLGVSSEKPACKEYYFLLKNLSNFNQVTKDNNVIEPDTNMDSITLLNDAKDTSVTIIWPKNFSTDSIVLKPHYARRYLLPDGTEQKIINPTQITFQNYHFVLVFETLEQSLFDVTSLENQIGKTLNYTEQTLAHLINLLPSKYNKEVRDTNYYKLLRSLAIELADAKFEVSELKDNIYLDSAHEEAIYNNFGVLVNLQKKDKWDYDKYKRLVQGVTKSLITGPTNKSIVDAIQLFTNFDVKITELYKANKMDPLALQNVNPQFAFVVEIEKPIGESADPTEIYSDVNYVLNIIKPAHTIQIVIIVLTGTENYRSQYLQKYKRNFSDSDSYERSYENKMTEGIFGWKSFNYPAQFKTANVNALSNNTITNGGLFIGPRYVLYDHNDLNVDYSGIETAKEFQETIESLLEFPIENEIYENADENLSSELNRTIKEQKFGLDYSDLIQLSNSLTTLNHYKLAFGSKLHDSEFYDFIDFLEEKDIMPDDNPGNFIQLNGTPIGPSKFLGKKITEYLIEMGMAEELGFDVQENGEYDILLEENESLRSFTLGPIEYHVHKKLIKVVETNSDKTVSLPKYDLFTKGNDDIESTIKVYVNGLLMPHWTYTELPLFLDQTQATGITFINDIVTIGDIVNILYLKDRNIIVSDFPITEEYFNDLIINFTDESYKTTSEINDNVLEIGYEIDDKCNEINKITENFTTIINHLKEDSYKKGKDATSFAVERNNDIDNWRINSIPMLNKLTLNITTLNNSLFVDYNQEINEMHFTLSDEIPTPIDSLIM